MFRHRSVMRAVLAVFATFMLLFAFTFAKVVPAAGTAGPIQHVVVVWLENKDFSAITKTSMPYLTALGAKYGIASGYYAVRHPSLPNYLAVWSGSTQGVTDDHTYNLNAPTLASQLAAAGKTWKAYQQNYPVTAGCHTAAQYSSSRVDGNGVAGTYARRHDPPMSFTAVSQTSQCNNIQPLANFTNAASLTFVTANTCNDAHDCSLSVADNFLKGFLPKVFGSAQWANTLLVVSFDEGEGPINGGGRIYSMVARAGMPHIVSATVHNHYSLTRTIENLFGLPCLVNACKANSLSEFLP